MTTKFCSRLSRLAEARALQARHSLPPRPLPPSAMTGRRASLLEAQRAEIAAEASRWQHDHENAGKVALLE